MAHQPHLKPLYITVILDEYGDVDHYPKGGGSSTTPRIKAFDNIDSADRSARINGGEVMEVTRGEIVE